MRPFRNVQSSLRSEEPFSYTNLTIDQITEGISLSEINYFPSEEGFYAQEEGMVMRSPVSPILGNTRIEDFEKEP